MKGPSPQSPAPLAALSHEFRTPLNAVLGMARLLEGTRLTAEQKAYVEALRQSGEHLLGLVGDVLDLAKLDAGAVTLNPAPVRIEALFQQVAELLSPRAHEKGLEIAWSVPPALPPVLADEGRLRQVLFNLAGNAVKFTPTGGVLLGCEADQDHGRLRLRLFVRDTGPGVPADRQARIFEPFGEAAEHAQPDSTGLGLAIVRRLADAHGGRAGIDSTPGQGATFWFEACFDRAAPAPHGWPLRGVCVVVASPSAIVREAAAGQLSAAGARAIACAAVDEAVSLAPPGAVILVDQPVGQGRRRIRPPLDHASLILLPAEARRQIAGARASGYSGYLIKPLRQVSLVARVLAALGREPEITGQAPDERGETETGAGVRVLLVEDDPINALLARKLLEREGCQVVLAANGEDARRACAAEAFDLVLMDRRLPGADGVATTRALRQSGITTPIVALTADAFEEDRQACLAAGMDDFLTKPLDPHALRALLARVRAEGWTKPAENAKLAS